MPQHLDLFVNTNNTEEVFLYINKIGYVMLGSSPDINNSKYVCNLTGMGEAIYYAAQVYDVMLNEKLLEKLKE